MLECPICGKCSKGEHHCSKESLAAIDAAESRANNSMDYNEPIRSEADRLSEGLKLLEEYDDFGKDEPDNVV